MLPFGIIILLILAGIVMFILKSGTLAKKLTIAAIAISLAGSIKLLIDTYGGGIVSLTIGAPPWNFALSLGELEAFMACLFCVISLLLRTLQGFARAADLRVGINHAGYRVITHDIALTKHVIHRHLSLPVSRVRQHGAAVDITAGI